MCQGFTSNQYFLQQLKAVIQISCFLGILAACKTLNSGENKMAIMTAQNKKNLAKKSLIALLTAFLIFPALNSALAVTGYISDENTAPESAKEIKSHFTSSLAEKDKKPSLFPKGFCNQVLGDECKVPFHFQRIIGVYRSEPFCLVDHF